MLCCFDFTALIRLLGKEGQDELPGMKRALLEIIATGVASTRADVERYANCTYLKTCLAARKSCEPDAAIQNTIKYLVDHEFIRVKSIEKKDESTTVCKLMLKIMVNTLLKKNFQFLKA